MFPLAGSNPSTQLSPKLAKEAHRKIREKGGSGSLGQKGNGHPCVSSLVKAATPVTANYHLPYTWRWRRPWSMHRDESRVTWIRGGHGITAKGCERRWDAVVCDENQPNRCSRHFDPRQTGVRRRRSASVAHAPRKRSGLGTGQGRKCTPAWSIRQEGSILEPTGESCWFESRIAKTPYFWLRSSWSLLFELPLFFSGYPSLLTSLI